MAQHDSMEELTIQESLDMVYAIGGPEDEADQWNIDSVHAKGKVRAINISLIVDRSQKTNTRSTILSSRRLSSLKKQSVLERERFRTKE